MNLDGRSILARPDLADARLQGLVRARRYAPAQPMRTITPAAAIRVAASLDAEQVDQLLAGEVFEVLATTGDFAWGQARRDGYVGYVRSATLGALGEAPTHRVAARLTYAFAAPTLRAPPTGPFSMNALLVAGDEERAGFRSTGQGWVPAAHLAPIGRFETDLAAVAERFLGAAYLWGGREGAGIDCSGLVQQALFACGKACPRDADQQELQGDPIARRDLARGDLVFWDGHVAVMLDAKRVIHANGFHMAVVVERLAEAEARIVALGGAAPTAFRRP